MSSELEELDLDGLYLREAELKRRKAELNGEISHVKAHIKIRQRAENRCKFQPQAPPVLPTEQFADPRDLSPADLEFTSVEWRRSGEVRRYMEQIGHVDEISDSELRWLAKVKNRFEWQQKGKGAPLVYNTASVLRYILANP